MRTIQTGNPSNPEKNTLLWQYRMEEKGSMDKYFWYLILIFLLGIFIVIFRNKSGRTQSEINFGNVFSGLFQIQTENRLLEKPFILKLKKLKDKWEYFLFKKVNIDDSFSGKEGYVFGEDMTKSIFGDDYCGEAFIYDQVYKAAFVQKKLKESGVELLFLFAPGKASVYPEKLPDYLRKTKHKKTNYETYITEGKNFNLNMIDFVQYFKTLKSQTPYPLFPKYGSHWSFYAECIVVDSTIRRLEQMTNVNLPNFNYTNVRLLDTVKFRDADIFQKMNLEVPKGNLLAYPDKFTFEHGEDVHAQKVLGIGDSYYQCFQYTGAMHEAFGDGKQWYYYNSILPKDEKNPEVWELDLKSELLGHKAILVLCNELNLTLFGSGFINEAYELFSNPEQYYDYKKDRDRVNYFRKEIHRNKDSLDLVASESQRRRISVDSLITEISLKKLAQEKLKKIESVD
ncbi:MAG: hypothetical protein IPJ83_03605 [Saprospiraceae bacterium]|nr:hypothetical protein [Candidatus Vicinibacter proximus]